MAESLRILILEDRPADAELIQFELQEAGLVFTAKVVMAEKDFVRELQEFPPDFILSDYDLPQYNGALALAEAKRQCPDVPFILVTGAISEDRAIETLTNGAKDYVMKSRISRLVPAVQRALAEAKEHKEHKKAEEELHTASLHLRTLIEASLDPLVTISSEGKVMDVNKATEEITGVPRDRIIGNDFSDFFTEPEKARAGYEKVFSEGSVKNYPLAIRHITGRRTEVLYNATTYTNEKGEVQGVFAAARDVTELKKAEEKLRKAHRNLETTVKKRTAALQAEIAEHKRMEEALYQSERNCRLLHDTILQGVVYQDAGGKIISMNPAAVRILGKSPEEHPDHTLENGEHHTLRGDGSSFPGLDHPSMAALRTGQELRDVVMGVYNPCERDYRWINVRAMPQFRPGEDKPYQVYIIFDDITERRRIENTLQNSEIRYRRLFEAAQDGILIVDAETGQIVDVNPFLTDMLNYSKEEFVGKKLWEIGAFQDIEKSKIAFAELQINQYIRYENLQLETKDGRLIDVEFVSNVYQVDHTKVIQCNIRDITERKRAEKALRESEQLYHAIGESIDYGVWVCDPDGRNIYASKSFLKLVGLTQEQCSNFGWGDVLHPDDAERTIAAWKECVRTGCTWDIEHRFRGADGRWHPILARGVPVRNEQGKVICWVGINLDISKLKQTEMDLKERTQQLENANRELESFSYSVSHDLRAPLRAIDGYSRMILRQQGDNFDENAKRHFNLIRDNVQKMGQLIDDLLAFSRMGREALSISRLNVEDLTRDMWEELKATNPDRPIDLKIGHVPPGVGDRSLIKQVLVNILSNAIKFTRIREVPLIEVAGYVTETENVYYVRDNGVGFDMQYHDKLFGVFQRLHSAADYEGTGVGLAIVQRIIHRHGGRVWAESKVDEGACFYFTLPRG
jgi:PAS domain S-box-containing protein